MSECYCPKCGSPNLQFAIRETKYYKFSLFSLGKQLVTLSKEPVDKLANEVEKPFSCFMCKHEFGWNTLLHDE